MKPKYKNIFTKKGTVIEDDVTKALINLLQYSPQNLTAKFLEKFIGESVSSRKYCYDIQVSLAKACNFENQKARFHLLIKSNDNEAEIEGDRDRSVADAVVYNKDIVVVIESKVYASKDDDQIRKQISQFNLTEKKNIAWQEITHFFRERLLKPKIKRNSKERFLIRQFIDYMEVINMSDFSGIDFVEDERKTKRKIVKREINYNYETAKRILKQLCKAILNDKYIGGNYTLKERKLDQYVWYCINQKKGNKEQHHSVYISPDNCGMDYLMPFNIFRTIYKHNKNAFNKLILGFCKELKRMDKKYKWDWYLEFASYEIKNWKSGQQKGYRYHPLVFRYNCMDLNKEILIKIEDLILKVDKIKSFKFVKIIDYADKDYDFNDSKQIVKIFIDTFKRLGDFQKKVLKLV